MKKIIKKWVLNFYNIIKDNKELQTKTNFEKKVNKRKKKWTSEKYLHNNTTNGNDKAKYIYIRHCYILL